MRRTVIDAGSLAGSGTLAVACTWSVAHDGKDQITEGDVKFDTAEYNFTLTPKDGTCGYANVKYDVESVLTHEIGHVFGLSHVSEASYPRMTMSTATAACDNTARTLGTGDMLGLESMY